MGLGDKILEFYLYTIRDTKGNHTEHCNSVRFHSEAYLVDSMDQLARMMQRR